MKDSARFLYVKNWREYQHYKDRRPPWIKLHDRLLDDEKLSSCTPSERLFSVLILLVSARRDNVIPYNLQWLAEEVRMRPRDVNLAVKALLRQGFLVTDASKVASKDASDDASSDASESASESAIPSRAPARSQEAEAEAEAEGSKGSTVTRPVANGLPYDKELILLRLMAWIGNDADAGTKDTIRGVADSLPPSSLAKVLESALTRNPRQRARYAVGALNSERKELAS